MATLNYRPDIDGLRALAVMAVVLNHLSPALLPGGFIGVDIFFVISGYLITNIISNEVAQGTFSFTNFYERRARRIFPALFAVLLLTLVSSYLLMLPSDMVSTLRAALGTLFFASNIVFWRDMADGYFAATDAGLNPLLHTWSLAVEEQFYLFFPILLLVCHRYLHSRIVTALIGCTLVSLAGAALLVEVKSVAVFFLTPFRAWELLAGSLLALNAVPSLKSQHLREFVAAAGFLATLAACLMYDHNTSFPGLMAAVPVIGASAIIHACTSGTNLISIVLSCRPVVYIGIISYSLYLLHWPLIVLTRYATGMEPLTPPYILLLLFGSLALGSLSYHFIEQPFRQNKRITRHCVFASSAIFVVMLSSASLFSMMQGGSKNRFTSAVVQIDNARSPEIPFINCDGRQVSVACHLGHSSSEPSILFWGDSHLLAWAPALNVSLISQDKKGLLATNSSCPPLLGVVNSIKSFGRGCAEKNLLVKNYLLANSNIKTVVMAASWSEYFMEQGPLKSQEGYPPVSGLDAATSALLSTIEWLHNNGKQVIVIGPVPVYDKSVPLGLALEEAMEIRFKPTTKEMQREKNAGFYSTIEKAAHTDRESTPVRVLDPLDWMCTVSCITMADGIPLYRDRSHLSVAGAMALEQELRQGLFPHGKNLADNTTP